MIAFVKAQRLGGLFGGDSLEHAVEFGLQPVTLRRHALEHKVQPRRAHRVICQLVPLLSHCEDAVLHVREMRLRLVEQKPEMQGLLGFSCELRFELGRKFVRMQQIRLHGFVVPAHRCAEALIHRHLRHSGTIRLPGLGLLAVGFG